MILDTNCDPKNVKPGQFVWFSYQRTVNRLEPGMIVATAKNLVVCIFPRFEEGDLHYDEDLDGRDPFSSVNRRIFTWRPTRKVWQEEGDSMDDPLVATLLFGKDDPKEAGRMPVVYDRHPDRIDTIEITPELALERWKTLGWRDRRFKL